MRWNILVQNQSLHEDPKPVSSDPMAGRHRGQPPKKDWRPLSERDKAQTLAEAAADINTDVTDVLCAGTQKHRKHKSYKGRSAARYMWGHITAWTPTELAFTSVSSTKKKKFAALLHLQTTGFAIIKERWCKKIK